MLFDDDDDVEPQLSAVKDYELLDAEQHQVCFSVLPLRLGEGSAGSADASECKKPLVLLGIADAGIKKYKEVVAWRLGLDGVKQPEIAVLAADGGGWIRLVKPMSLYEAKVLRPVLITAQMLHFLRRKPDEPEKNLWSHLRKVFDKFDVRPSEGDFRKHRSLMKQFAEKDPVLAKSEILRVFIEGKSRKNISEVGADNIEIKQPFIADDDEDIDEIVTEEVNDESDEEDEDLFDSICAICDNGGDLLCCDGPCMRSFHAKKGTGEDSYCRTLGYTEAEVEAMKIFLCKNCEYKQHQCFICGKLGPSDGAAAEVFLCNNATCGHFYHPKCVAQQLHPNDRNEASELEKKITDGFSFTCPIHWCFHCKGLEDRTQEPLQFAVCRRCPKSYHRKCLPREISFEDIEEEDIITRAWELSKRILIYCMEHEIDSDIDTPARDHIRFPAIKEPVRSSKEVTKTLVKKKKRTFSEAGFDQASKDPAKMTDKDYVQGSKHIKQTTREVSAKVLSENLVDKPEKKKAFLKERTQLEPHASKDPSVSSPKPTKEQEQELAPSRASATRKIPQSSFPIVDSETEKRVIALLGKEVSSLTLKDISRNCRVPSTHVYSGRQADRIIAQGKLERSVQAVEAALKKLENGGNVNDAKAVCEPDVLRQLAKWHSKLRVYISPFIHGTRYSSFGRHFTKVEKLVEIVDKLHWYVEPGDTIVDFCCGANDFSRLMKEKLDKVQKNCDFKNYDLIQPQNRFCFEKRDWMTVHPKELPRGSKLIMGLNPPFGVKASLANKFIDKALMFKPKLIILIVPKETKRLDKKKTPYDLIWEDNDCLAGKAFYLPGSVDLNDKTVEGWNASAPPLYLWSHPDWTMKHMKVAEEHNHTCIGKVACHVEESNLSDNLPVQEKAEPSDKLKGRLGDEKDNAGTMAWHTQEANQLDDLPMSKLAEATNKWNFRSGKEGETTDKSACSVREDNLLDNHPAKKQARSEEEKETLGNIAVHVREAKANISDSLPLKKQSEAVSKVTQKKQSEAVSKVISRSGKDKENGRYDSSCNNKSKKQTPDHAESLPPEKQVEVAYEETQFIPNKKIIHNEQRGAGRESRRHAPGEKRKSDQHSNEQRAAGLANIKFRDGGDSDMNISSPEKINTRRKSRSYSPIIPTEHPFHRTAHPDSYMSFPAKETSDLKFNKATCQGNHLGNIGEYSDPFMRKNDDSPYVNIDKNSRMHSSSIEEVTNQFPVAPTVDLYSLQSGGDDGRFYRRNLSSDMPMQFFTGYGGQVDDTYLQSSGIRPTESQTHQKMHGGISIDDIPQARYSLGSSGARFSQPASVTPYFGLSVASAPRGSVMDKYAYGFSGPSGLQSSVMDKYAPPLDGTNHTRPTSFLLQQYPFGQPGNSGGGWPHN